MSLRCFYFFFFFFFFFLHFSRVVCNVKITSHNYVLHDVSPISVFDDICWLKFSRKCLNLSNATLTRIFLLVDVREKMCPQYTDAPAVGNLTIKLQNSTLYKCLNLSLTGSCTVYNLRTYVYTFVQTDVHSYARMENLKTICPGIIWCGGHKKVIE